MASQVVEDVALLWEHQAGEPGLWFSRFDRFFRPLGPERSLLRAYKNWYRAEKNRESRSVSAPTSWREAAERWAWRDRAQAWDVAQRLERLKQEDEERRRNRERRLNVLNGLLARVSEALLKLEADDAKWADVTAAVRVAVQELRHEYGEDVTTVRVEAAGLVPEWATAVIDMEPEQLDWVITNLSLAGAPEGR